MNKLDVNSNIICIKKYVDEYISHTLNNRKLNQLSNEELVKLDEFLNYYNNLLNNKIELQQVQLDSLKEKIRKKIDLIKKNN